jgi:5,5'-dehydrodivanillate O-demethylase oxygenase subunit
MLTKETNERITQTGADTPTGQWLRRYWWPVGAVADLEKEPVQPVRILSENLTLYQDLQGNIGLIGERCAHRAISLAYGIPQENGLRCAYHGWTYNTEGKVVDMPFEPACLPLKVKAYPVQVLGGLIWAYLGPQPMPLLPRWEALVRTDITRTIAFKHLPCNWVQCMDNSMDPVHFEHLHGNYGDYYNRKHSIDSHLLGTRHLKIEFDVFEYGVYKRRLIEGDSEDSDDWTIGHPILFPYILCVGPGINFSYQIRVPMDDHNTMHILYSCRPRKEGEAEQAEIPVRHETLKYDSLGLVDAPVVVTQDEMAWVGQGPVSDRTQEHLATSDKGVILYHNMILENIAKVERGEDPVGVIRDPAKNEPYIALKRESGSNKMQHSGSQDTYRRQDRFFTGAINN